MAKSIEIANASVFLNEGSVDLKLTLKDGTVQKCSKIPFDAMKKGFSFNKRKGTLLGVATTGSKHGDRGLQLNYGGNSFTLYPQAKGHFYGSPVEEKGPASTLDELFAALA